MNVYLIEAESRILLDDEIKKIVKTDNKIIYNAFDSSIEEILREASYVSMFDEMKYLVVKNADFFGSGKLKEEEEEMLLNYLEEPYPLCTILFTTYEKLDNRKKITKKIKEKYGVINIPLLKGIELYNKVTDLLIEKKYLAEKDTINYIIQSCLGNYDLIYNEISKIDLYYNKPTKITLETVKNIISRTMIDNNFKFIDAVILKDTKKAFQVLDDLITLKVEPLSLINLLAREFRLMINAKILEQKKYPKNEILKGLKLMDWQLDKTLKNSYKFHEDDLKDYLVSLEKLDYKIKIGAIDKLVGLRIFLIDFFEY